MKYAFWNEDDGCRGDGMLLQFLSHPQVYLRIEAFAKIWKLSAEENKEFIIFVDVGNCFPANRRGEHLPAYGNPGSRQGGCAPEICLWAGNLRKGWKAVKGGVIISFRFLSVITQEILTIFFIGHVDLM